MKALKSENEYGYGLKTISIFFYLIHTTFYFLYKKVFMAYALIIKMLRSPEHFFYFFIIYIYILKIVKE